MHSGSELIAFVSKLADGRTETASHEDIFFCFRLLLGRNLNPEEIQGHMSLAGRPVAEIVASFLNSAEFAHRNLMQAKSEGTTLFRRDGYSIYADPNDFGVGRHVAEGDYEPHVAAIFRRFVKEGDVVVDIGANIGFFSLLAAKLVGQPGRVVAIEPNPSNCRLIEASRIENGFTQLQLHALAAGLNNGILALHSSYSNGSVARVSNNIGTLMRSEIVQAMRLDDLLQLERLDFVKIDVEGFEFDALAGFKKHLARFKPKIVSEFAPGMSPDPAGYISFLKDLGYHITIVGAGGSDEDVGQDADAIIEIQKRSGGDHIDILAV